MTGRPRVVKIGETFDRLTVAAERKPGEKYVYCTCSCGTATRVTYQALANGDAKSCGCLRRDLAAIKNFKHGHNRSRRQSPTYMTWGNMVQRCTNPRDPKYPSYGARGISVCERWRTFANFLADMGPKPEGLTIDRVDVDGSYEPGNCRWATASEQRRNQRPRTHCSRDHEMTRENTLISTNGGRSCRTCHNRWQREDRARRKAAAALEIDPEVNG